MFQAAPRATARQHDLALHELAHRCANDLSLAAIILGQARNDIADPRAQAALDDAAACIQAIALVHRTLEMGGHEDSPGQAVGSVEIARYLTQLTERLRAAYLAPMRVGSRLDVDLGRVPPETARVLGLIVCELARNAAKHAFADVQGKRQSRGARDERLRIITIAVRAGSTPWRLTVSDNGNGMPGGARAVLPDVSMAPAAGGQGLALVRVLAGSLAGRLEVTTGRMGTRACVTFDPARCGGSVLEAAP